MPFNNAETFTRLGMPYPLANAVVELIETAGGGQAADRIASRLQRLGMPAAMGQHLAMAVLGAYGQSSTRIQGALSSLGMPVELAMAVALSMAGNEPMPTSRLGALIGDSRLAQGYGINGGSTSVWPNRFSRGPQHWLSLLTNGRVVFPDALSRAVGGHDLGEILDTLDADIAAQRAGGAGFFGYLAGVNSFRAGVPAETVLQQEAQIIARLKATGLPIIVFDDWPGAGPTYASTQAWWDGHRALHAARQAYLSDPAITLVDGFSIMSNPDSATPYLIAGTGKEELYADTYLHIKPRGARALSTEALIAKIAAWFPAPEQPAVGPSPYGGTVSQVLNRNPTLAGTGGPAGTGGTGVAAPDWAFTMSNASGCTQVLSKDVIEIDGRSIVAQRSVVSGTTTTSNAYVRFGEQTITVTPGQKLQAIGTYEVAPGSSGVVSFELGIVAGNNWTFTPGFLNFDELLPSGGFKGRIVSEVVTVPAGTTSVILRNRAYLGATGTTPSLDLKFGECYLVEIA